MRSAEYAELMAELTVEVRGWLDELQKNAVTPHRDGVR